MNAAGARRSCSKLIETIKPNGSDYARHLLGFKLLCASTFTLRLRPLLPFIYLLLSF